MRRREALFALTTLLGLVASGCGRLEPLSTKEALDRLTVATSKIYDAHGDVIADLHGEINRDTVPLQQIPESVRDAVVAIEDERFWHHQGLDVRSIARAALSNLRSDGGSGLQGGSTISQQLAKNLYFPRPARTLGRKIAEARVTWELERQYTKSEILEMYLNTIYLGRGAYGLETAAHSYFGRSVSALSLSQGAFLAGLIHEPARYEWTPSDPASRRHERIRSGRARRNVVLERMRRTGAISRSSAERVEAEPLEVRPPSESRWTHPYFVDYALRQLGVLRNSRSQKLDPRFDFLGATFEERSRNVYLRGLRIYTTLDRRAQDAAESAIANVLPSELDRLSAALAAIEPATGYVRALVGGRDYYPDCDSGEQQRKPICHLAKVNLALGNYGGGSGRQPGSSFKPFVLTAALERGIPLYQSYPSAPFSYSYPGGTWNVSNYEGEGGGARNLLDGTAHSVNAVFAHLEIDGIGEGDGIKGAEMVAGTARRMGAGFPSPDVLKKRCGDEYMRTDRCLPADFTPAIALGAKEVSPLDMASAFSTFANDGTRVEPTAIVRITDADGHVLYRAQPAGVQAVPQGVARGVTYALQRVIAEGTGVRAGMDRPAAGKTGTSQAWRDAWFDGYVPQLAASIWVGNPVNALDSMIPANGYPFRVVGGTYPAMIWREFMIRALDGVPVEGFGSPPSVLFRGGVPVPTAPGGLRSVIGMHYAEARRSLQASGYDAVAERGCDPRGRAHLHDVYSQDPPPGTPVDEGARVTVFYQGGGC